MTTIALFYPLILWEDWVFYHAKTPITMLTFDLVLFVCVIQEVLRTSFMSDPYSFLLCLQHSICSHDDWLIAYGSMIYQQISNPFKYFMQWYLINIALNLFIRLPRHPPKSSTEDEKVSGDFRIKPKFYKHRIESGWVRK